MTVLGEKHFERKTISFVCSLARLTLLPLRRWSEEFLKRIEEEGRQDEDYLKAKEEVATEDPLPKDRMAKEGILEIRGEKLYRKSILWIPKGMIQQVIKSEHDTKVAGYMGQDKMIELI